MSFGLDHFVFADLYGESFSFKQSTRGRNRRGVWFVGERLMLYKKGKKTVATFNLK